MSTTPPPPPPQTPFPEAPYPQGSGAGQGHAKSKPLGKIALGVAIVGFVFACIPGALIVGWVLLPIAFILAIVALFQSGPKGFAIAGLITSIVGTIVGFVVFFAVAVDAVDDAVDEVAKEAASDYGVTIDATSQGKDGEGKPTLVVDLTFTNKSDEAASYMFSLTAKAFQDGIELETGYASDDDNNSMKDIKPGKSIKVREVFILNGATDVTVEVGDAFGLSDDPIVSEKVSVEAAEGQAFGDDHSQYVVTIDEARQIKDYEGKPTLQVGFTFTNNGDRDQSFVFATDATAFQDGTELEDAILMDSDEDNVLKEIKPGKSIKVQQSFVLNGPGDVTVEVTELISFDETKLATKVFPIK